MNRGLYPAPDEEKPSEVGWVIPGSMMRGLIRGLHTKGATMTDRGLYPAPDEEPPVGQSPAAASLPRADAPEQELKPCPFCGSKAEIHYDKGYAQRSDDAAVWYVECTNNNCMFQPGEYACSARECAEEWNRRDGEDARIAEAKAQGAAEERARIVALLEAHRGAGGINPLVYYNLLDAIKGDGA